MRWKLSVPALVVLVTLVVSAQAQPQRPSAAQRLVGAWQLVTRTVQANGKILADPVLGEKPLGRLYYDASGGVMLQMMRQGRTAAIGTPTNPRDAANPRAVLGYDAYFGKYTVDERAGTITHHVEGSLFPEDLGKSWARPFTLDGDTLTLRFTSPADEGVVTRTLVFRRVEPATVIAAGPPDSTPPRTVRVAATPDWARFRGPNGSGLSTATKVPTEFGPERNLLWKLPLPQGHSSPILQGDRIYLTALRDDTLVAIAIDRNAGKIVWERGAPKVKTVVVDKRNNPASPSPAVEDNGVYVFFPDYGLIGYDRTGKQLWTMPLGPFNNIYGMGASPVIVGENVVLACDQSLGSYVMAVNKRTGRVAWRVDRPEAKSGHSTPIVWRGPDGKDQIIQAGSFLLTSYDATTGRKLWWVGGLSFEMKSTPVIGDDGTIYVNGYGAPVNDPGNKVSVPTAEEVWKTADVDGNGVLSKAEFPKFTAGFWFGVADLDINGSLTKDEWSYYRAALDSENGMLAIRLGGSGDMTDKAIRWKYQRSVPQLPSPILFKGVLYMVNDNGIVTTLNPDTGEVIRQGRLTGAPGAVFASPIAADGNLFFTTEAGAVVVVAPGGDLKVTVVNDLKEDTYATPALADGRIYVRTTQALYAFGS